MTRHALAALIAALPLSPAAAHPHVFVDVALRFQDDGAGNLTGVEVTWSYDDFFSLLIFADMGLDPDGDGQLTEAELKRLWGFDLVEWPEGFEGDLYIHAGGQKIALDHPVPTGIRVEAGRIVATHTRSFGPVPADGLRVEPYDPTYYVDYTLAGPVTLDLTRTEFRILAHMAASPGRAFERAELVDACLPESEALDRTVDSHISNLRRKLAAAGADGLLTGVRGFGYRLDRING